MDDYTPSHGHQYLVDITPRALFGMVIAPVITRSESRPCLHVVLCAWVLSALDDPITRDRIAGLVSHAFTLLAAVSGSSGAVATLCPADVSQTFGQFTLECHGQDEDDNPDHDVLEFDLHLKVLRYLLALAFAGPAWSLCQVARSSLPVGFAGFWVSQHDCSGRPSTLPGCHDQHLLSMLELKHGTPSVSSIVHFNARHMYTTCLVSGAELADDLGKLGSLITERRAELGLSLRDASRLSGVPVATLSRVEQGRTPDLGTFRRLIEWLGVEPDRFFTPTKRTANTPDAIASHLKTDTALSAASAEKISGIVRDLYQALAIPDRRLAVHLRAAKTFSPSAMRLFGDLLSEVHQALDNSTAPE